MAGSPLAGTGVVMSALWISLKSLVPVMMKLARECLISFGMQVLVSCWDEARMGARSIIYLGEGNSKEG